MITIRLLRARYPDFFLPGQVWFEAEDFLDTPLPEDRPFGVPGRVTHVGVAPPKFAPLLPLAVTLVDTYLRHPFAPIWGRYLWCRDLDAKGQRIYVGGVTDANGRKFEIHRHLHLTAQWGTPVWD